MSRDEAPNKEKNVGRMGLFNDFAERYADNVS